MPTAKTRSTSTRAKSASAKRTPAKSSASKRAGLISSVRKQPYAGAAIATGAVAAVAAAAAGAFFFSRRDKSFSAARDELGEKFSDMSGRIKDGLTEARSKAGAFFGHDDEDRTQAEIAEEAQSLKETGDMLDAKSKRGVKTGAIAY